MTTELSAALRTARDRRPPATHAKIAIMAISDKPSTPAATKRTTGLSPKEQKLQAMREKLAAKNSAAKPAAAGSSTGGFQAKGNVARKTSFQRKAT